MEKKFGIENLQEAFETIASHENVTPFTIFAEAEREFLKSYWDASKPIIVRLGAYDYSFTLVTVNCRNNVYIHSFECTKV